MIPEFQLSQTPIETGVTLLEASAGTGKTYTITGLVLRLIAEHKLPIDEILVVTYTDAATEELKTRIREGIREACHALHQGESDQDLLNSWIHSSNREEYHKRLELALASFDEARIHTILGFCRRILGENSVETGFPAQAEILKNPAEFWHQLALDYWRNELYNRPPLELAVLANAGLDSDSIAKGFEQLLRHPDVIVRPACDEAGLLNSREALRQSFADLRLAMSRMDEETFEALLPAPRFKGSIKKNLHLHRDNLRRFREGACTPQVVDNLIKLRSSEIKKETAVAWAKKNPTVLHPFFDACEDFARTRNHFILQTRFDAQRYLRKHHRKLKDDLNVLTFDDLLTLLDQALKGTRGGRLQANIQGRILAALIDEFQDTDPLQYSVFKRLFLTPEHYLFLIGDPKQAIYGFRGADIFSYLQAKQWANHSYTLNTNWRSTLPMVSGVNALFSAAENAFVFEDIEFRPAQAAKKHQNPRLFSENGSEDGLQVVYQEKDDGKKSVLKGAAREAINEAMVREVSRLLSGKVQLDGQSLQAEHIAVLTRSNYEALEIRQRLTDAGIPAVVYSDAGIFEQVEAQELLQWILCVIHGGRAVWLKGLLIGPWFKNSLADLISMEAEANGALQEWSREFRELRERWQKQGFLAAFLDFQQTHDLKQRILGQAGGDRKWTNLFQIADLLNQYERESGVDPHAVLRWLKDRIRQPETENESHLVRLEKDENAVTIMTMHKSKGLQFPVVFCPFLWLGIKTGDIPQYHDPSNPERMVLDASETPDESGCQQMRREALADQVRLFYVALTRAQCKTYLFWGDYPDSGQEAWSALFGADTNPEQAMQSFQQLRVEWQAHPPEGIRWTGINTLLELEERPVAADASFYDKLECRQFSGHIAASFNTSSFSSLTSTIDHDIRHSFEDELSTAIPIPETNDSTEDIFHLPGGTRTGDWFHAVLEKISFESDEEWTKVMESEFERIDLEPRWLSVMERQIRSLMSVGIPTDSSTIRLSKLSDRNLLREAPFHLGTPHLKTSVLKSVLNKHLPEFLRKDSSWYQGLPDTHIQGFLKGFMDLVIFHENRFYLLDWKSNQLGRFAEAYDPEYLPAAMCQSAYPLQYLIYTVALVRFLRLRKPGFDYEQHFGGVLYIFLRGIDQEKPGRGVYFHKPESSLISALDQCFARE